MADTCHSLQVTHEADKDPLLLLTPSLLFFSSCNYLLLASSAGKGVKFRTYLKVLIHLLLSEGFVHRDTESDTRTAWTDGNEARAPSHCKYHECPGKAPRKVQTQSQECQSARRMSREAAVWSVRRPPATLRNVDLLCRLALHHAAHAYFADDLQEG